MLLEGPADVGEQRLDVVGQAGVVEGREVDRPELQVLCDESGPGPGMPFGDDRRSGGGREGA